jgi:hypothetical protein
MTVFRRSILKPCKIAFLFLLYEGIDHLSIWEDFFRSGSTGKKLYNIYSHVKSPGKNTPDWIRDNMVSTFETGWCGLGLIRAVVEMLKTALRDRSNKYFCLVSGACIPLRSFDSIYKSVCRSTRSRMNFKLHYVFDNHKKMYTASQWVILNRKIARDYIALLDRNNKKAVRFLERMKNLYLENGIDITDTEFRMGSRHNWIGGCPDEVFPINWLIEKYGIRRVRREVKNTESAYTYWSDRDIDHPVVFSLARARKMKDTILKPTHLFGRKFKPDAARYLIGLQKRGKRN